MSPSGRGPTGPITSPRRRPPLGLRALLALLGVGMLAFNAALMLSDRAPGALRRLFGDAVERWSARIDARAGGTITTEQLPESDVVVHVAVWALAALLVGLAVWTWSGLVLGGAAVLGVSVLVEVGQEVWADTRAVEASDLAANALGVGLGVIAAGACYLLWSAGAALFGEP